MFARNEKIYPAYVLKYISNREKQVIRLIISNGEKQCHYLAVKKLSALLRGIFSKHNGDIYCLNFLHSFATEKNLNCIKNSLKLKVFVMWLCFWKTLNYYNLINIKNLIKNNLLFMQINQPIIYFSQEKTIMSKYN